MKTLEELDALHAADAERIREELRTGGRHYTEPHEYLHNAWPAFSARLRAAEAEVEDLRAITHYRTADWADRPTPEDAAIEAAYPTNSGRHNTYREAMRLVGDRRSKGALVALVSWLLIRLDRAALGEP